jgi:hypothetical protein
MKRFFWKTYYRLREPVTKADITKAYCRVNGITIVDLRVSKLPATSLLGLPDVKRPPYCFGQDMNWKT